MLFWGQLLVEIEDKYPVEELGVELTVASGDKLRELEILLNVGEVGWESRLALCTERQLVEVESLHIAEVVVMHEAKGRLIADG